MSSFFELQSMLLVEENHVGASTSTHANGKMLYTKEDRPRGHGRQGRSARNGGSRQEQNKRHNQNADNSSGPSISRGSHGSARSRQEKVASECWYCGKKGHRESECWKKKVDSDKAGSSRRDAERRSKSHYVEGSERAGNGVGPAFAMKHKANSMAVNTSK
jgi:hypothetical protein